MSHRRPDRDTFTRAGKNWERECNICGAGPHAVTYGYVYVESTKKVYRGGSCNRCRYAPFAAVPRPTGRGDGRGDGRGKTE